MLLDGDDDPGGRAITAGAGAGAGAGGVSGGFRLANGQCDTYPDEDTVLLGAALRIVQQVIDNGVPSADTGWCGDG
ncbi:hypothetical protein [Streptomyces camelliae]|uniref:Uncharacterized protein n=1 Tax=Streptomyces camelliae TaxID=3004093 RepID=A0ABY7PDY1_9ACTN|nr:hypothetical protein [Streptomyces sp. HUAS 2-6]WBO67046.1 hypothetical protein O1G22_31690 [Streptomyces sp. HUAS 2-6]